MLCNKCLEKGTYLDILKIAKLAPLHNGECQTDLNNYRPISTLSPLKKVFEIILVKRVVDYWENIICFQICNSASEESTPQTLLQ